MTLPERIESERAVLGTMLVYPKAIVSVLKRLKVSDFTENKNRIVYDAMVAMFNEHGTYDLVTVTEKAKGVQKSYIAEVWSEACVTESGMKPHIEAVKDASLKRQYIHAMEQNLAELQGQESVKDITPRIQKRLFEIREEKQQDPSITSVLSELEQRQKEYEEKYKNGITLLGYDTGFEKLNNNIDGLRKGHVWVIGAWHGTGKTSFALNILNTLLRQDVKCSMVTLEMSPVDLTTKLLGIETGIGSKKIEKGRMETEELFAVKEAKKLLGSRQFFIHTIHDIEQIMAQIRYDVYANNVSVVFVDYLQKISNQDIPAETPRVSDASIRLANLAQELQISLILLSQISNEARRGNGAGAGFKGSGTIEASADLALLLIRDKGAEQPDDTSVKVEVQITKNKYGFDGSFDQYMQLKTGKFTNLPFGL